MEGTETEPPWKALGFQSLDIGISRGDAITLFCYICWLSEELFIRSMVYRVWDVCKLKNEACVVVGEYLDNYLVVAFEEDRGTLTLETIPKESNGMTVVKSAGNEAAALLSLCRPMLSVDGNPRNRAALKRSDRLFLRGDAAKTCTFDCLHMVDYPPDENGSSESSMRSVHAYVISEHGRKTELGFRELEHNYCIARSSSRRGTASLSSMRLLKM